jgi:hypothetical protein
MVSYSRPMIGAIALLIWIASLALPVETDCGSSYANQGYIILGFGWLGPFDLQFGWFANPFMLWVIGRLLFDRRPGIIPAIVGLGLALTALAWKTTPRGDAPGNDTICAWHAGFYLWIACAALLALVALIELIRHLAHKSPGGVS